MPGSSGASIVDDNKENTFGMNAREVRRSEPNLSAATTKASVAYPMRSRSSVHAGSEAATAAMPPRRSPRLGAALAQGRQLARGTKSQANAGALSDITNNRTQGLGKPTSKNSAPKPSGSASTSSGSGTVLKAGASARESSLIDPPAPPTGRRPLQEVSTMAPVRHSDGLHNVSPGFGGLCVDCAYNAGVPQKFLSGICYQCKLKIHDKKRVQHCPTCKIEWQDGCMVLGRPGICQECQGQLQLGKCPKALFIDKFSVTVTKMSGDSFDIADLSSTDKYAEFHSKVAETMALQATQIDLLQGADKINSDANFLKTLEDLGISKGSTLTCLVSQAEGESGPQGVAEYAPEIFARLHQDETLYMPRANYMETQTDINGKMRAILIDWLIEVHMKYRLRNESLHLTVNLIDRYLSHMPVQRKRLQLVGVCAMFIATKFEEITPPEVNDFVYITDNAYTKDDILRMECTMLSTLSFQIVVPTAAHFLDRLEAINQCDDAQKELVRYLIELALVELRMIQVTPSTLVSSALLLSNEFLMKQPRWPAVMARYSQHAEADLRPCVEDLRALVKAAPGSQLQAVRKKYLMPQHHSVAGMTCLE